MCVAMGSRLRDRSLYNSELNCFLHLFQVLDEVKSVIAQNIAGGIENDCITIKGFIFLHCLFIQRGRNETTWTVLRKFGYEESLELTHNYLYAK